MRKKIKELIAKQVLDKLVFKKSQIGTPSKGVVFCLDKIINFIAT
jgi:hypothetical protein